MYDAIVVGARVAGAPTAMLLARSGYRVLLVDRSSFPSDIMSTHYIHPWGMAFLQRWGLYQDVAESNCPPIPAIVFNVGGNVFTQPVQPAVGVDTAYCPRRTNLDNALVRAAVQAGAELRERFSVQELVWEDDRVVGIRGRGATGESVEERARFVIGADGQHSLVARSVQAEFYHERPPIVGGYYSYFSDAPLPTGAEFGFLGGRQIIAFATNDGLTCVGVARPVAEFPTYRADIEAGFWDVVDRWPDLAGRLHAGRREERWIGTAQTANYFRQPHGPGWALVGDAGYHKDFTTGFGISDAFRDAALLARALDAGFSGRQEMAAALAGYQQQRDEAALPLYHFTLNLASATTVEQVAAVFMSLAQPRPPAAAPTA